MPIGSAGAAERKARIVDRLDGQVVLFREPQLPRQFKRMSDCAIANETRNGLAICRTSSVVRLRTEHPSSWGTVLLAEDSDRISVG
jgi:hypothetical protein